MYSRLSILCIAGLVACAPQRVNEEPIIENGDRVSSSSARVEDARERARAEREEARARRDSVAARAAADCEPAVCDALARGEVALSMTGEQVMAATATAPEAWSTRQAGSATVMVPASSTTPPEDAVGTLAMVQLSDGRVTQYSYREVQGIRVVSSPEDATTAGRADALAEALVREGDELVARGELDAALDRYDRADVLRADDPELDYRIATVLDQQLRPVEALMRYKLFLHRLELERIGAVGDAYADLAEAIAHARERVIILEDRTP